MPPGGRVWRPGKRSRRRQRRACCSDLAGGGALRPARRCSAHCRVFHEKQRVTRPVLARAGRPVIGRNFSNTYRSPRAVSATLPPGGTVHGANRKRRGRQAAGSRDPLGHRALQHREDPRSGSTCAARSTTATGCSVRGCPRSWSRCSPRWSPRRARAATPPSSCRPRLLAPTGATPRPFSARRLVAHHAPADDAERGDARAPAAVPLGFDGGPRWPATS